MERLGFILGVLGLALTLVSFEADRFQHLKGPLFYGGVALVAVTGIMLVWPLGGMWRQWVRRRRTPIYLGDLYEALEGSFPVTDNVRQLFMGALIDMVQSEEIVLLGRLRGEYLEPIPPAHFDEYSLVSIPSLGTGRMIFQTVKGTNLLAVIGSNGGYDRLHIAREALASIPKLLSRMEHLKQSREE